MTGFKGILTRRKRCDKKRAAIKAPRSSWRDPSAARTFCGDASHGTAGSIVGSTRCHDRTAGAAVAVTDVLLEGTNRLLRRESTERILNACRKQATSNPERRTAWVWNRGTACQRTGLADITYIAYT